MICHLENSGISCTQLSMFADSAMPMQLDLPGFKNLEGLPIGMFPA